MTVTKDPELEDFLAACVHEHIDVSDEDAYTVAEVMTASEHLTIRRRTILEGEWQVVQAALDALPVGSIIAWAEEDGPGVAVHSTNYVTGKQVWLLAGARGMYDSEHLARHGVPLTVIA